MLRRWLQARHDRREHVSRDARDLLTFLGDGAYGEARTRAREHRAKGDSKGDRHWGKVAVEIARSTGYVIGEKVADCYAQTPGTETNQFYRRAVIAELVEISEAIRDMSRGVSDATTLHNAEAAVHRLVGFGKSPSAVAVGRELRAALSDLASARTESARSLAQGEYPPAADSAGKVLARLRDIVLPAR